MPTITGRRSSRMLFTVILVLSAGCGNHEAGQPDHPRLTPHLTLEDVTFRSSALNRDMQYRVVLPLKVAPRRKLQVVYLLHGGGGGFRDWTNDSDVARFAESGFVLVMPEGGASYYTNAADPTQDRYEDYIVQDLISEVENKVSGSSRPLEPGDRGHLDGRLRCGKTRAATS